MVGYGRRNFLVRSTSFLEFLHGTGFLLDLVIKLDQSLLFSCRC